MRAASKTAESGLDSVWSAASDEGSVRALLPTRNEVPAGKARLRRIFKLAEAEMASRPARAGQGAGEKAIIFTELREIQSALYYFLRERLGIRPFINGDSQGRQRYIDNFSGSPGFDVIILSTLAAGAGLNITAANHVFHFTRAWNPAKENQATDRAYRIGQQKDVSVYCPTLVADDFISFEVRLDELLKRKAGRR